MSTDSIGIPASRPQPKKRVPADSYIGQTIGALTVERSERVRKPSGIGTTIYLWCRCECGTMVRKRPYYFVSTKAHWSCGCLRHLSRPEPKMTHGYASLRSGKRPKEYNTWAAMMSRCHWSDAPCYDRYKACGIRVCERWHKFENFLADMGLAPTPAHSIDRIDNNGHYEPGNCRWATRRVQSRNTSVNRWIEYKGVRRPKCDWVEYYGITDSRFQYQVNKLGVEKAFAMFAADL